MSTRVLIIEPDEALLQAYCDFLSTQGFELATARTGPDALAKMHSFRPTVVLLEPDLPNGWGRKLINELRDGPHSVPVVVLTRRDAEEAEYPIQEFFVKPLSMTRLAQTIDRAAVAYPSA